MHTATLFTHDHRQAVLLPQALRLPGTAVSVTPVGNALVLLPMDDPWEPLLTSLALCAEDGMPERHQPPLEPRGDPFPCTLCLDSTLARARRTEYAESIVILKRSLQDTTMLSRKMGGKTARGQRQQRHRASLHRVQAAGARPLAVGSTLHRRQKEPK